jgi:hypothetical protein
VKTPSLPNPNPRAAYLGDMGAPPTAGPRPLPHLSHSLPAKRVLVKQVLLTLGCPHVLQIQHKSMKSISSSLEDTSIKNA